MSKKNHPLLELLSQSGDEPQWANRRAVGLGVFVGFLAAIIGCLLTGTGWWFIAPVIGFALAWRIVHGRWPFSGSD